MYTVEFIRSRALCMRSYQFMVNVFTLHLNLDSINQLKES